MTKRVTKLNLMSLLGLLCIGILMLAVSCSNDCGHNGVTGEASKIASDAHEAYRTTDWTTYASWVHPDGLARYELILRPAVESTIQIDSTGQVAEEFKWLGTPMNTQEFMNMSPQEFFSFSMSEV